MITEFRKSINATLFERMSSPFYGAFVFSWVIWNWKPIYLTLFIDESKIEGTKIEFIVQNYADVSNLIFYPLISTIIILLIIPFLSNGAYWTSLKFKKWRFEKRNNVEKKTTINFRAINSDSERIKAKRVGL